ncbi:MAG: hypothetical protein Q7U57_05025 [Methylovulum sp.]|nr:hypothetical protein [Methylovulum sp.]
MPSLLYAERMIVETDCVGNLKQPSKLPANCRIEAILWVMEEQAESLGNTFAKR